MTSDLTGYQPVLEFRRDLLAAIRTFFGRRNFLEVETPLRIVAPPPEIHIDAEPAGEGFLRTSPELHMKRLLAAGYPNLFQVGPCFRRGEEGPLHHPEYSMLEWYRVGADYLGILEECRDLLLHLARELLGTTSFHRDGHDIDLAGPWEIITVSQAFTSWAGWDPTRAFDANRFDLDLVNHVEPNLPRDRPCILKDYPAEQAALARCTRDTPPVAERWELYLGGLELANAYSELTDPAEHRERFAAWNRERAKKGSTVYPDDQAFLEAVDHGLPECGGIALGVDRLLMLLAGKTSLGEVLPFREN